VHASATKINPNLSDPLIKHPSKYHPSSCTGGQSVGARMTALNFSHRLYLIHMFSTVTRDLNSHIQVFTWIDLLRAGRVDHLSITLSIFFTNYFLHAKSLPGPLRTKSFTWTFQEQSSPTWSRSSVDHPFDHFYK
jgi:hypothetical protein